MSALPAVVLPLNVITEGSLSVKVFSTIKFYGVPAGVRVHREEEEEDEAHSRVPPLSGSQASLLHFNRNHERGGFFKGFFNCDQPPSAVTHVIQAAVMTPSKEEAGDRGGYEGNRASEVSHLPLNRSPNSPQEVDRAGFEK
ncbi:hypothetical protein JOQ06_027996 [Pogonophryne albipinna]|uniref:Uncharacterized protein n=1 Tax=Pogonophryne albipinna TaxID=1090488 RepID=A0AAD6A8R5_9TELE|nr:hypothetical protein JOQ06_027986 [Pogonophryne albipinna]KAJ4920090.1 hypothetical protein JOQ06_027996 [Pogonophryne albipinna]